MKQLSDSFQSMKADKIIDEDRILKFHKYIEKLFDYDYNICRELTESLSFESCVRNKGKGGKDPTDYNQLLASAGIDTSRYGSKKGLVHFDDDLSDGGRAQGSFLNGLPHGFFRASDKKGDLNFFQCFIRGESHGPCWKSLVGGGLLIDPEGSNFTGNNVIYLYPDCQTAFVGIFEKGIMVSAFAAEVTGTMRIDTECCGIHLPELRISEEQEYCLDPSDEYVISHQPTLKDPYESHFVRVDVSQIQGAGEGLFSKIYIEAGTVVAFYNGIRVPSTITGDYVFDESPYKISLNKDYDLDIPDNCYTTDKYCSSLGHKICHSFSPNCEFDAFDHPRFGVVICIVSTTDIPQGEELTVNYKYDLNFSPSWYKKLWAKHQKSIRGMPSWQEALTRRRKVRHIRFTQPKNKMPISSY